jgi:(S)-2-hydroxy-acid oxidase
MHLTEVTSKTLSSKSSNRLVDPSKNTTTNNNNNNFNKNEDYIVSADYRHECFNVHDFQLLAKRVVLPKALYDYLASGTGEEQTLAENALAFQRWFLRPRVMRPVGKISTSTQFFGHSVTMPVFCSPAGVQALCDPDEGECATVRACATAGIMFGLSQHATRSIEQVANAAPANTLKWYQLYILKDRKRTLSLIRRAIQAGYQGLFVTVDSVRLGYREADARNGFNALPPPHRLANYDDNDDDNDDARRKETMDQTYNSQQEKAWDQNSEQMFEQDVSWEDIAWIKREAPNVPLVVKGIMTGEDAELAIAAGADGVMVSNHGGRQLDGALASIDALPEVAQAVAGRVPIWLDSGVRRGTDVLKALALGASAVGIGKPIFFALSVGGEDAVSYMLQLLQTELEAAMAICGIECITDITSNLVSRHPALTPAPQFRSSL